MTYTLLRTLLWLSDWTAGAEQVALWQGPAGYRAHGEWVGSDDGLPVRAGYRLELDAGWGVRRLRAAWATATSIGRLRLQRDAGGWRVNGEPRPDLAACVDLDLAWTPLTNTLPIRRLGLGVGEQRELSVAYITPPQLAVVAAAQRYTRLGPDTWRYEAPASGFVAEITVDEDGLVIDYPPAWRRAAAWDARS